MPLAYFLNAPTAKVGKSARRNLRFLHFRARYTLYGIVGACRTFTQDFLFRFDKRIVSAPAPLPLTSTPKNTVGSTVRRGEVTPPYSQPPIDFRRARCSHRAAVQRAVFYR